MGHVAASMRAGFLKIVGKKKAVRLMVEKAETFGQAQYYAVQKDWQRTTELLEHLAEVEAKNCAKHMSRLQQRSNKPRIVTQTKARF